MICIVSIQNRTCLYISINWCIISEIVKLIIKVHTNNNSLYFRFDDLSGLNVCRLLLPDLLVLAFSIFSWYCTRTLGRSLTPQPNQDDLVTHSDPPISPNVRNYVLPNLVLFMLLISGISLPNLISSVYFLIFLLVGTFWSFHRTLHHNQWAAFFRLRLFLMIYSGSHILVLYFYQFQFFQEALPVKSLPARYRLSNIVLHYHLLEFSLLSDDF